MDVTNRDIYEVYRELKDEKKNSVKGVAEALREKFCGIKNGKAADSTIYIKAKKIYDTVKKFQKTKQERQEKKSNEFLDAHFPIPTNTPIEVSAAKTKKEKQYAEQNKVLKKQLVILKLDNDNLLQNRDDLETKYFDLLLSMENLNIQLMRITNTAVSNIEGLREEVDHLTEQFAKKSEEADELGERLVAVRRKQNLKDINRKLKRRDSKINNQQQQIKLLVTEQKNNDAEIRKLQQELEENKTLIDETQKEIDKTKEDINELKKEKIGLQKKVWYSNNARKDVDMSLEEKDEKIAALELEKVAIEKEKVEIQTQLITLTDDDGEIQTFQDGRYRNEIREVIMELLSMHVSMNQVNNVIRTVIRKLTNKSIPQLPSNSVKSRLMVEAKHIAHVQIKEAILSGGHYMIGDSGHTLHGDGTTKNHREFQNFQMSLTDGKSMSIGLTEMGGKDTKCIVDAFNETITDIAAATSATDEGAKHLISSIKNTMSDMGPTNPTFNAELLDMRKSVLPDVITNWHALPQATKCQLSEMGNFYCKMHVLVNFASECDKTLKLFEEISHDHQTHSAKPGSDSGTARLIRTSCKAFCPDGSEEAGVAAYFKSFLECEDSKFYLASYRGNRFNILFYNAGALHYHLAHVKKFLRLWPKPNLLLQAVQEDVHVKTHIAGLKALGIIDKLITGPYWRLVERTQSVLQLNPYLKILRDKLERWSNDATPLMEGMFLFADVEVHQDEVYNALFSSTDEDVEINEMTVQCLEMLCACMLLILERQCEDQLDGGKYADPSADFLRSASSVPTTNTISERDFAMLDLLLRLKPASSVTALEAQIMWCNNGTKQWLETKSQQEKKQLLDEARQSFTKAKEKYQQRKATLRQQKLEALQRKQKEKETAEMRQQTRKIQLTDRIDTVWKTCTEVDQKLGNLESKQHRAAVVNQIMFHKEVLHSNGPKELFYQSRTVNKKREMFPLQKLVGNLKEIIQNNPVDPVVHRPEERECDTLKPAEERRENVLMAKKKLSEKIETGRVKRAVKAQKRKLTVLEKDPSLLVGKKIKHNCIEENETQQNWYDASVICIHTLNTSKPCQTMYTVKYDEADDELWNFELLKDLKNGDLIICD